MASPVLVGAVTVLITIVAVFLAYNANQGLPFVPTYNVKAQLPSGAKLVRGNDVRVGGFRVGLVEKLETASITGEDGERRSVAVITMKLDKTVEPLAQDTRVYVRPRSALGLKFVELTPGKSKETYAAGDTIPLSAGDPVEYEDLFGTFDEPTRENSRIALEGFGDAFAARGPSLNGAIASLLPLFTSLTPVMNTLNDPETELDEFFKQIGRASTQVAPVAEIQAQLFSDMADTFEAIGRNPDALRATIEKSPGTMDVAIESFRAQRPFLANFADLSRRLRPTAQELAGSLPAINTALRVGQPVLRESVEANRATEGLFKAVEDLVDNPNTLLALKDLTTLTTVTAPLLRYIVPYQTVCNYPTYFFTGLSGHIDEEVNGGTGQRVIVKSGTRFQDNNFNTSESDRPADVPSNLQVRHAKDRQGEQLQVGHPQPYVPAVDAQGNADCQAGQWGFADGPLATGGRYKPSDQVPTGRGPGEVDNFGGGSHIVSDGDQPGLAGPTYKGVPNLKAVP